jgi:ketosteroid isomerase-like protein
VPLRIVTAAAAAALVAACASVLARAAQGTHKIEARSAVVEIRVYTLKPGARERFHQLFLRESLPMLRRRRVDVVAYGPSLHDANSYFLVRAFASLDDRTRSEEAFYESREWTDGPRDAVLAAIESYSTAVVDVDAATLGALRGLVATESSRRPKDGDAMQETRSTADTTASDVATLLALNEDYIRSVQTSDVTRFRELLADDFLCSLPDGSMVDRDAFLERTAAPAAISDLQAHEVTVRVMGNFALVHARTTFTTADGRLGAGRYTDAWARRNGRWVAVAAHVTRF